jgi:SAM-dependent methyltransferase
MDPDALVPHGLALEAYFAGDTAAEVIVHREDGIEDRLPAAWFFRTADAFTPIERAALEHCRGRILDIGAGAGIHSLVLQSRGLAVTAIDVSPQAVEVMVRRGVTDARVADVFEFQGGPFDTLLMLGHGIGMTETLAGLDVFLRHAQRLASPDGRLLIHSLDVQRTADPRHLAYHEVTRQSGRYVGEVRFGFEFPGRRGGTCSWLHVDPRTLAEHAAGVEERDVLEFDNGEHSPGSRAGSRSR